MTPWTAGRAVGRTARAILVVTAVTAVASVGAGSDDVLERLARAGDLNGEQEHGGSQHQHVQQSDPAQHHGLTCYIILYATFVVSEDDGVDVTADPTFVVDDVKLTASGELADASDALDPMVRKQGNVLLLSGVRDGAIVVPSGARERWRFVNSANGRYFHLRLAGHPFTVCWLPWSPCARARTAPARRPPAAEPEAPNAPSGLEATQSEFEMQRKEAGREFAKVTSAVFDTARFHEATMQAPSTAVGPVDAGAVSFEDHIVPLFERSRRHHERGLPRPRGLRRVGAKFYGGANDGKPIGCPDRPLYDRLTLLEEWQTPSGQPIRYVKAGESTNSYLYNKTAGGPVGDDTRASPRRACPPQAPFAATDIAMVKKWFESGAPK